MLARADTHTPVSYWMELPLIELDDWKDTVLKVAEREKRERGKNNQRT